jgi:transposase InsO family protein
MRSSMSRKTDCYDNAPVESLWASLKRARTHGQWIETRQAAQSQVMNWLAFYNATRLHSTLGYVSPMHYEKNWLSAQLRKSA